MTETKGFHLTGQYVWNTTGKYDLATVLKAFSSLVPTKANLYLEGTSIAAPVQQFLEKRVAAITDELCPGTIFPKPKIFHIACSEINLEDLAELSLDYAEPEVCDHLHVYIPGKMLVCGYDFGTLPLGLCEDFSEEEVSQFCKQIDCSYKKERLDT